MQDGIPWFVANGVCKILEIANSRDAMTRLDECEKFAVGLTDVGTILADAGVDITRVHC
ncbi:MAG: BRO family protein [Suipraeoptans sp.]